jgi:hypothetical protein
MISLLLSYCHHHQSSLKTEPEILQVNEEEEPTLRLTLSLGVSTSMST